MSQATQLIASQYRDAELTRRLWSGVRINVKTFGAQGDGVTDDALAFELAVEALPEVGGVLEFPPGRYYSSRAIFIENKDVTIVGAGVQQTLLFFPDSDGIIYSTTNLFSDGFMCFDLSLVSVANDKYTGIRVAYPSNMGSAWVNTIIERVVCTGSSGIAQYTDGSNNNQVGENNWKVGIYLENSSVSFVSKCVTRAAAPNGGIGVWIAGWTVDVLVQDCRFYGSGIGVNKSDKGEGLIVEQCIFVNVERGVVVNEGATQQQGVWVSVQNSHINYSHQGIAIIKQPQVFIDNCLIYKQGPDSGGFDILLSECDRSRITNSSLIVRQGSGYSNGVVLQNSDTVILGGNIIQEREVGVWVQENCNGIIIRSDNVISDNQTNILNSSPEGVYLEPRQCTFQKVEALNDGQTQITIPIPANTFLSVPKFGNVISSSSNQWIHGYYDYEGSTSTIAKFNIKRNDGATIGTEIVRFSITLTE
ncbi:right-handed parallel beta-helix repeat-containing protein [Paenibacillus sp. Marseille-Q4541]|uniref:right-handed parallel beta-helix repeat-containing protein n=1 Tax=Paenibacillus sp. Marseille-Q4541 TaxID=2831522 RepID=UPI001BAAEC6F|nr:right-handed parallel beta-helix repeat-containing protein [Paenibacillus sp. Marseille-Q4541]